MMPLVPTCPVIVHPIYICLGGLGTEEFSRANGQRTILHVDIGQPRWPGTSVTESRFTMSQDVVGSKFLMILLHISPQGKWLWVTFDFCFELKDLSMGS